MQGRMPHGRWHMLEKSAILWRPFSKEPQAMPDEILTLPEVAQLLKVADKTVYTMAQQRQLPAFKVRGQWRFKRLDIDHWIETQKALHTRNSIAGRAT